MGSQNHVINDRRRINWTPSMERFFIKLMVDEARKGNRTGHTFNKRAWNDVAIVFNRHFRSSYDVNVLKSRYANLLKQFNDIKTLVDQNEFSWDDTRKMAHGDARSYRNKGLTNFDEMCLLYAHTTADGRYSLSSHDVDFDDEIQTINVDEQGYFWDECGQRIVADNIIWDNYIMANPNVDFYRKQSLLNYHDLELLFGNTVSKGFDQQFHRRKFFYDDISQFNTGEEKRSNSFVGDGLVAQSEDLDLLIDEEEIQSDVNNEFPFIEWTALMERCLIDIMLEQADTTSEIDTADLAASFKDKFGIYYDKGILGNQCKRLEKQYINMRNLLSRRGFWWDDMQQMVKASNDAWDSYLAENPGAESYRTKSKPNYNDLCLIYGKSTANDLGGRYGNCKGSDWRPEMDRFFIDLMLEQVRNGSMLNQKFSKLAWTEIVAKFSAEFGSQHDKQVLKSRFLNLRKRFYDTKALVDRSGFSWDEMQQKIIADDDLWDACVQEDLDAISYRNRRLPNLNDLYLIFGDEIAMKKQRYSTSSMDSEDSAPQVNIGEEDDRSISPPDMYLSVPTEDLDAIPFPHKLLDCCDDLFASFSYEFANERSNFCSETKMDLNNAQKIETSDIFSDLQSPAREFQIFDNREKRKSTGSSKPVKSRKIQRTIKEEREDENENRLIERVVHALKSVPDLSDEIFLEACKLLEDERKSEMFVAMDVVAREKWLLRRLRW